MRTRGWISLRSGSVGVPCRLQLAVHAEHAGYGEAGDVGVENTDLVAPDRQAGGQVDRYGRLAHAPLARRNGEHPGPRRARRSSVRPGLLSSGRGPSGRPCGPVASPTGFDLYRTDPGQGADAGGDLGLDLAAQRARRRREGDADQDPASRPQFDSVDHAEFDDVVTELRVDHPRRASRNAASLSGGTWPATSSSPTAPGSHRSCPHRRLHEAWYGAWQRMPGLYNEGKPNELVDRVRGGRPTRRATIASAHRRHREHHFDVQSQ